MDERDEAAEEATREAELWRMIVDNFGERATLDDESAAATPSAPEHIPDGEPDGDFDGPSAPGDDDTLDRGDRIQHTEHFSPPNPPAMPLPAPPRLLAWFGVLGVPVLVLALGVLRASVPSWMSGGLLLWFLGGFVYLVATMRRSDDEDGFDDGARL